MILAQEPVESWDALETLFEHPGETLLFRGHGFEEWPLQSTFHRTIRHPSRQRRIREIEAQALIRFQERSVAHLTPDTRERLACTIDWWTIMRHHGAPVRLLDWSRSAKVAAYFAVSTHPDSNAAIWAIDVQVFRRQFEALYPVHYENGPLVSPKSMEEIATSVVDVPITLFPEPSFETERMAAQQTAFSFLALVPGDGLQDDELERAVQNIEPAAGQIVLTKFSIPARLKRTARDNLREMDISAASLFPGVDGLGRSISEFVEDRFVQDSEEGAYRSGV